MFKLSFDDHLCQNMQYQINFIRTQNSTQNIPAWCTAWYNFEY